LSAFPEFQYDFYGNIVRLESHRERERENLMFIDYKIKQREMKNMNRK